MSNELAEVWAAIPEYEGWYDVSADGQRWAHVREELA